MCVMRPDEMMQVKHVPQRLVESKENVTITVHVFLILLLTKILVLEKNQSVPSTLNSMFLKNFSRFHIN